MARTKQLKVRISDEFQQLLASAWRNIPRETKVKGIDTQSDFVINAIITYMISSKVGKDLIKDFDNIEEIDWWKNKDSNKTKEIKETFKAVEDYFDKRKK